MCQQYEAEVSILKHSIIFIHLDTYKTFTAVLTSKSNVALNQHNGVKYPARRA